MSRKAARWTEADWKAAQGRINALAVSNGAPMSVPTVHSEPTKPRKYRNTPVMVDGIRFDSKLEARCYQELLLRKAAGDIWLLLRQVPFPLEAGVVYRCDFFTVSRSGAVEVIDATGVVTPTKRDKIKQVYARYGIHVTVWRGKRQ
jgi:hypothetical protein